jgi:hypothetical protein
MVAPENKKDSFPNLKKLAISPLLRNILVGAGTGTGLATFWDQAQYGGEGFSGTRALNYAKNFGMGASAPFLFKNHPSVAVTELTVAAPLTNAAVESIKTQQAYQKANKNIFEKFNDLSPTQKTLAVAASGLTAAVAVPALMNLSSAAKRLADGRAVRLSTSIRKRRNQDKDLVIGVQPVSAPTQEEEPASQQEESKGFLSKIFG